MTRLRLHGIIYLHLLGLFLMLLSFLAIKDINYSDLSQAPSIGGLQGTAMFGLFAGVCFVVFIMFFHGILIKNPKLGFVGTLSLFILYTALFGLVVIAFYPYIFDQSSVQHSYRMILIPVASLFVMLGSILFITLKFSDERERRWFVLAVRQEMKTPSKMLCPECASVVSSSAEKCYKCDMKFKKR